MAAAKYTDISVDYLRKVLDYNYKTGEIVRLAGLSRDKTRASARSRAASGTIMRYVSVAGHALLEHRVAWAMMTGQWPPPAIKHLNGDPSDNRLINLCAVGNSQGFVGPAFYRGEWLAFIHQGGRYTVLGPFVDQATARAAYQHCTRGQTPCPGL